MNLLGSLQADPVFTAINPQLPASKLNPDASNLEDFEDRVQNIQQRSQRPIPVVPAASARVRYSRLNGHSSTPTTVAGLDFEVTPFMDYDVVLEKVQFNLIEGSVESLTTCEGLTLPITCRSKDDITLLYKLTPSDIEGVSASTSIFRELDISITAIVRVADNCHSKLTMDWRTNVDFSVQLNPTFGASRGSLQRTKRPSSIPVAPSTTNVQGGALPSTENSPSRERAGSVNGDFGVTVSFSGPETVEVGLPFKWDVLIVNHSSKSRKLAMISIPKRKRGDPRKHASKSSFSSIEAQKDQPISDAIVDENFVYAMQRNISTEPADLVCMNTDIRIG